MTTILGSTRARWLIGAVLALAVVLTVVVMNRSTDPERAEYAPGAAFLREPVKLPSGWTQVADGSATFLGPSTDNGGALVSISRVRATKTDTAKSLVEGWLEQSSSTSAQQYEKPEPATIFGQVGERVISSSEDGGIPADHVNYVVQIEGYIYVVSATVDANDEKNGAAAQELLDTIIPGRPPAGRPSSDR